MKSNVSELEEDAREGFSKRSRKDIAGVVQEIVGKRRYLERLQDELEKEML